MSEAIDEKITAYVTKYALTKGIYKKKGEVTHGISSSMFCYDNYSAVRSNDWHRTLDEAKARAEEMRVAKIATLKKAIARLEKLRFD
jgi:hypothetical protein